MSLFPAIERVLDLEAKGPLVLLSRYQSPQKIRRVGNHRRMRGGNKLLKRVFFLWAFSSLRSWAHSRAFYERKRREGKKRHTQALIALARGRVNVLWAMLRDGTTFESPPLRA